MTTGSIDQQGDVWWALDAEPMYETRWQRWRRRARGARANMYRPPRRHREPTGTVRRVCLAVVTLAVLVAGVVAVAASADAHSAPYWPRQAELRQDAIDQADRAAER